MNFISRPESTLLYSIKKWKLGQESIKEVNMQAHPVKIIDIGKNVTNRILGIGIKNEDSQHKIINIDKINDQRIPKDLGVDREDLDIYRVHSHIRMNFNEQVIRNEYYSTVDIISSLGGVGASVFAITNALAFFFIINFMINISRIIRRQKRFKTKR